VGCLRTFQVVDQKSMDSLKNASLARSSHEVSDHDYHHISMESERAYIPFQRSKPKPAQNP
jgi:hypothetical protein